VESRVLGARYRLMSKLGQGGMGSVWLAEHLTLRTEVAVKLIDPSIAESREALGRFQREAQSAAELRSTHIVQIFDYGIDEGTPYIAMELLQGESLAARLARLSTLTPSVTVQILSQVARALSLAHEKGVIHRDLKPDNIFLVREGADEVCKVLDFGIAKKLGSLSGSSGIKTNTGAMLGTPYYMSPEQALGQSNIDHRTDIWSLAIIAYECLTGVRPFEKETLGALLMAICQEPLPTPSKIAAVPPGFDEWFARAAARELSKRFQSAADAASQLRVICGATDCSSFVSQPAQAAVVPMAVSRGGVEFSQTASPASVTIPGLSTKDSRRKLAYALLSAMALVLVGGYFVWRSRRNVSPTATELPTAPISSTASGALVASTPSVNRVGSIAVTGSGATTVGVAASGSEVVGSPRDAASSGKHPPVNVRNSTAANKRSPQVPAAATQSSADDFVGF